VAVGRCVSRVWRTGRFVGHVQHVHKRWRACSTAAACGHTTDTGGRCAGSSAPAWCCRGPGRLDVERYRSCCNCCYCHGSATGYCYGDRTTTYVAQLLRRRYGY
jgi:hypothetical protein